jgi:hypothetical protein
MPLPLLAIGLELAKLAAPWIAEKVAGSKGEEVARVLVNTAEAVTGKSGDAALDALKADPNLVLQYQSRILTEETGRLRDILADVQNARGREIAVGGWANPILAAVIVAGFLGTVYMVLGGYVEGLKDPLTATLTGTLIGYVSAKADQVVSYYFGSSASSKSKDATIANLTK